MHLIFSLHTSRPTTRNIWEQSLRELDEVLVVLFTLNRADIMGSGRPRVEQVRLVEEFESLIEHVMTEAPPLSRHDLAVSGYDLMRIGIPPSDRLGKIQNALLQEVLDDPRRNRKDYLTSRARELMTTV